MKENSMNDKISRSNKSKDIGSKNRYRYENENDSVKNNNIIYARLLNKEIGKEILISKPITLIGSHDSCDFIIKVSIL